VNDYWADLPEYRKQYFEFYYNELEKIQFPVSPEQNGGVGLQSLVSEDDAENEPKYLYF
jgi:hypothetical protein